MLAAEIAVDSPDSAAQAHGQRDRLRIKRAGITDSPRALSFIAKQRGEAGRRHRSGEKEALAQVTAQLSQCMVLLGCLDALGHDRHPEAVGELDDRVRYRLAGSVLRYVSDELSVDFDGVHGR